jgi:hypothetical protein
MGGDKSDEATLLDNNKSDGKDNNNNNMIGSDGLQRPPTPLPKGRLFTLFLLTLNESFSEVTNLIVVLRFCH